MTELPSNENPVADSAVDFGAELAAGVAISVLQHAIDAGKD